MDTRSTNTTLLGRIWAGLHLLQVRLRFIAVFVVVFMVIANWERITGYWQHWIAGIGLPANEQGVSSNTEFFCPMCPGVHSAWPSQCPVCSMPLVRRTKGDMGIAPDGSLVRMQISPYRLQLGGITTVRVEYRDLHRDDGTLWSDMEPFHSQPRGSPPLQKGEPRTVFVCPKHSHQVSAKKGRCPLDGETLQPRDLAAHERLRWQCPLHRDLISEDSTTTCERCAGLPLAVAVVTYAPDQMVLAVPETAVVESSGLKVVFQQSMPGVFDAVPVELGEASQGYYPVISGVTRDSQVVAQGAFLLDAQTRLDPDLAAAYFGAAARGDSGSSSTSKTSVNSSTNDVGALLDKLKLTERERALALRQRLCPITNLPLGSMGAPISVVGAGQEVQLCCAGCRAKFEQLHKKSPNSGKPLTLPRAHD